MMDEIIGCIAEYLDIPKDGMSGDTDLQNDLGLSSFDMMDLSCELEEYFHISIEPEQLSEIHSIKDIYGLIPDIAQHTRT